MSSWYVSVMLLSWRGDDLSYKWTGCSRGRVCDNPVISHDGEVVERFRYVEARALLSSTTGVGTRLSSHVVRSRCFSGNYLESCQACSSRTCHSHNRVCSWLIISCAVVLLTCICWNVQSAGTLPWQCYYTDRCTSVKVAQTIRNAMLFLLLDMR